MIAMPCFALRQIFFYLQATCIQYTDWAFARQFQRGVAVIKLNWTLWLQFANFFVLMFVLNFLLYRPLRKVLAERRETVDGSYSKAKKLEEQIERKNGPLPGEASGSQAPGEPGEGRPSGSRPGG